MDDAWKKWKRATNTSRKEVAKAMEKRGYRTSVWTKRDKNRTIVQIFGRGKKLTEILSVTVAQVNAKYADRFALEIPAYGDVPARMKQYSIVLSEPEVYHDGETAYALLVK